MPNHDEKASTNPHAGGKLARLRAKLPVVAVAMAVVAVAFHTMRGSKPAPSIDDMEIPVPPGMTREQAKAKMLEAQAAINSRAREMKSGGPGAEPSAALPTRPPAATQAAPAPVAVVAQAPAAASPPTPTSAPAPAPVEAIAAPRAPDPIAPRVAAAPEQKSPAPADAADSAPTHEPARAVDPATREFEAAQLALREGFARNAMMHLWEAVRVKPDHAASQRLLTQLLVERGEPQVAIEMLEAALRRKPNQSQANALLATLRGESSAAPASPVGDLRSAVTPAYHDAAAERAVVRWR